MNRRTMPRGALELSGGAALLGLAGCGSGDETPAATAAGSVTPCQGSTLRLTGQSSGTGGLNPLITPTTGDGSAGDGPAGG